jgi:hypothetical protein
VEDVFGTAEAAAKESTKKFKAKATAYATFHRDANTPYQSDTDSEEEEFEHTTLKLKLGNDEVVQVSSEQSKDHEFNQFVVHPLICMNTIASQLKDDNQVVAIKGLQFTDVTIGLDSMANINIISSQMVEQLDLMVREHPKVNIKSHGGEFSLDQVVEVIIIPTFKRPKAFKLFVIDSEEVFVLGNRLSRIGLHHGFRTYC